MSLGFVFIFTVQFPFLCVCIALARYYVRGIIVMGFLHSRQTACLCALFSFLHISFVLMSVENIKVKVVKMIIPGPG